MNRRPVTDWRRRRAGNVARWTLMLAAGLLTPALPAPDARADDTGAAGDARDLALMPVALAAAGGDLVMFTAAHQDIRVATLIDAAPAAVEAVLRAPASYREAIPALIRTDVVGRRPHAGGGGGGGDDDVLVAWELEIPLFNLKGRLWVSAQPGQVTLELVDGDFAPGLLRFHWAAADAGKTVVLLHARVNNQAAGWLIRKLVAHSRYAGAAVNATTGFVALRALAAVAEHPRAPAARRPVGAGVPPPLSALDGRALAALLQGPTGHDAGAVAVVQRATSGRLALVAVAAPSRLPAGDATARLLPPELWHAFPGWKKIERRPPASAGAPVTALDVDVTDNLPFVDFDARWHLTWSPAIRAQATAGDGRGAVFGWDVVAGNGRQQAPASVMVLGMYPRLEKLGYVPRKFIEAEPLLEHGMSLALAYVDALSAKEAIEAASNPPAPPPARQ